MGACLVEVAYLRKVLAALERASHGQTTHVRAVRKTPGASCSIRHELEARLSGEERRLLMGPLASHQSDVRTVDVEVAEAFLLAMDDALGQGSGRTLQEIGQELGSQYLVNLQVSQGDAEGSMRRLLTDLTAPFPESHASLTQTPAGLAMTIIAPGRPRTARVLRHIGIGYVRAAFIFSLEATSTRLRIVAETIADRSSIVAHYRSSESQSLPAIATQTSDAVSAPRAASDSHQSIVPPPSSRPRSSYSVSPGPTSERVDRILRSARSGSWPAVKPRKTGQR
jgi:hypothetical protein